MTEIGASTVAVGADANQAHGWRNAEPADSTIRPVPSRHHDDDSSVPLPGEASAVNLLTSQSISSVDDASLGDWTEPPLDVEPSSREYAVGRKSTSPPNASRSKHSTSNGHHIDPGHRKSESSLSTIDETSAAASSSYAHGRSLWSSANGYSQDDASYRHANHSRISSADFDEAPYSPTTYPPTSEEDSEAKRVQQNLERWAAEERQRRKAQRSSKILSNRNSISAGPGGLAQRLSILRPASFVSPANNLGAGPSSERLADGPGASPNVPYQSKLGQPGRDSTVERGSRNSSAVIPRGLQQSTSSSSFGSSHSHGSLLSDEHRPNRRLPPIGSRVTAESAKDPFRDPSDGAMAEMIAAPASKPTPTATRPIVTVGRASSIQRRALETQYSSKGKGKGRSMPTIVATDTDAEGEDSINSGDNPFASTEDGRPAGLTTIHQGGLDEEIAMEMESSKGKGLDSTGDLGEHTMDADGPVRPVPARHSTSDSKFREVGISDGDDWDETVGPTSSKYKRASMRMDRHSSSTDEVEEVHKRWWTDLLCGCSRDYDDDEQAGRTNPME